MITHRNEQKTSIREFMRGGREYVKQVSLSSQLPEHIRAFSVLTLIPGASIGYHVHNHEAEFFYIMEGIGRVRDDDQYVDVSAGDSMITLSGHGHSVENTGEFDMVILSLIVTE